MYLINHILYSDKFSSIRSRYNNGSNRRRNGKLRVCFFRSLPQENIDQGYHTIRLKTGWEERTEREKKKRGAVLWSIRFVLQVVVVVLARAGCAKYKSAVRNACATIVTHREDENLPSVRAVFKMLKSWLAALNQPEVRTVSPLLPAWRVANRNARSVHLTLSPKKKQV